MIHSICEFTLFGLAILFRWGHHPVIKIIPPLDHWGQSVEWICFPDNDYYLGVCACMHVACMGAHACVYCMSCACMGLCVCMLSFVFASDFLGCLLCNTSILHIWIVSAIWSSFLKHVHGSEFLGCLPCNTSILHVWIVSGIFILEPPKSDTIIFFIIGATCRFPHINPFLILSSFWFIICYLILVSPYICHSLYISPTCCLYSPPFFAIIYLH